MTATGTEARVCQDIALRQAKGIAKYGTTVESNPLGLLQWYKHHYEELLDAAVYVKRIIEMMEGVQAPFVDATRGSGVATGGGTQVRHDGWGQAVGAQTHDPHAELRKTWEPGQRWQVRPIGSDDSAWAETRGFQPYGEPAWFDFNEYRRHPDDKDENGSAE